MLRSFISQELLATQEFQTSLIRLATWIFMLTFLGFAGWYGYYQINWKYYGVLFGTHLVWYSALLVSVVRSPSPNLPRRYLGMVADLSGVTFVIYLGGESVTPFYLFYIWIFISQGSRYGKEALKKASIGSVISYSLVVSVLDGWSLHLFDSLFLILVLIVLPLYQYSLLRQLHEARQAAESANQARGNFLATMTHELRTPLSGVVGMSRLLGSTQLDNEQRDYVDAIRTSANMLQSLIGDILDLSKIDAGKLELKPEPFDIRRSISEVAGTLADQALGKGVELLIDVTGDVPREVYGDPLRFRQVLFNLLGNAVKFTEEGYVRVEARIAEARPELPRRHLHVAVRDTGVGMPAHTLGRIFEKFWQADVSASRGYGGTGLGTAIARDLTRLMKGHIGVESTEGRGSTFWVALPFLDYNKLHSPPPQAPSPLQGRTALLLETCTESLALMEQACRDAGMRHVSVSAVDKLARAVSEQSTPLDLAVLADNPQGMDLEGLATLVEKLQGDSLPVVFTHYARRPVGLFGDNATALVKPFTTTALWEGMSRVLGNQQAADQQRPALLNRVPEGQGSRVLVAEDDSINGMLIENLLTKGGHAVVLVRDGQSALDEALKGGFDLALVDLRMPKMDGADFARRYRQQEQGGHLPIVALTANAAEDARDECLAAGMDDFLTKPVDPEVLDKLLRRYRTTRTTSRSVG